METGRQLNSQPAKRSLLFSLMACCPGGGLRAQGWPEPRVPPKSNECWTAASLRSPPQNTHGDLTGASFEQ